MSIEIGSKSTQRTSPDGDDGETETKQQFLRLLDTRTINTLPLHSPHNYSPHNSLEFDLAVQDHCRHQCNLNNLSRCHETANQAGKQLRRKFALRAARSAIERPAVDNSARTCKLVVSGDVAAGKTCLVNRFGRAIYSSVYQTTIGVDFDLQRFNILGHPYVLQIWDTAGLERFKCITSSYYRGCQVALIIFDMSNLSTLANVVKWRDEILASSKTFDQLTREHEHEHMGRSKSSTAASRSGSSHSGDAAPLLFLVGTKCDLPLTDSSRAFMTEQANRLASIIGAELWLVSAQTGENVNELFNRIAALSFNRCLLGEIQRIKFDASTMGACLKERILQQQRELWSHSSKLIKITRKRDGDERRTRCVNVQCVIK